MTPPESDHPGEPDHRRSPRIIGGIVGRATEAVAPSVVGALDINAIVEEIDVNALVEDVDVDALMARVDVDALLDRVDPDALLDRVDPNALLDRVDVDALLDRVDPNALLDRVDVDAFMARVDIDALMTRVDVDALMDRVDIDGLVERSPIGDMITAGTTSLLMVWLNQARRILAGVDAIIVRTVAGLIGRELSPNDGPPALVSAQGRPAGLSGLYAGPVTRLVAYMVDSTLALGMFSLGAFGVDYLAEFLFQAAPSVPEWLAVALLVTWLFAYFAVSWGVAGRTVGMGLAGLRVVRTNGETLHVRDALVRTLAFPLSFLILGLGFLGLVVGAKRRALHDLLAGTVVVFDWGDETAQLPAPIMRWVRSKQRPVPGPTAATPLP